VIVAAVHSSSPRLAFAVVQDGRVLIEETLPAGKEHLENIAPFFCRVMASLDMQPRTLDGLGVAVGPGSFSGIRVGMSFVKGLALALGTPLVGISSLELLARQALSDGECGAAVIDARRGQVYACAYRRVHDRLTALDDPRLILGTEFPAYAQGFGHPMVLCGDPVVEGLGALSVTASRVAVAYPSVGTCAYMAWERLRDGIPDGLHALTPLYIRRSDAEENKRGTPSPVRESSPEPKKV
jgi:tRNA threonylcarbamoyladenosine biosynthesis protein TsaB